VGDYDTTQALVIDPTLTWNTFLGTGGAFENDYGQSIAVDSSGNVYVAGHSNATWGSPVRAYSGSGYDVFVAKLDNSGNLVWNTFLGGSGGVERCDLGIARKVFQRRQRRRLCGETEQQRQPHLEYVLR
jgi:hypothetical protein